MEFVSFFFFSCPLFSFYNVNFTFDIHQMSESYTSNYSKFFKYGSLNLNSASPEEAATILQRWLFFEFLREFSLVQKITFADNAFTTTPPEGKVILHTFGLPGLIQLWLDKEAAQPDQRDGKAERFEKTKRIINFARHNILMFEVRPGAETFNSFHETPTCFE